jgi:ligand-binding sensor domain-containing protein/signal transduction histidine kinase
MQLNNRASRWVAPWSKQRTWRVLLLFLLSLATGQPLIALPVTEFNPTLWQTEEGLPNNHVLSIAQTRDGYLWVGTREGLARFDGIKFTPMMVNLGSPQPIVNALCAADDGSLWIGTEQYGLYCYRGDFLVHYETPALTNNAVIQIKQSGANEIWIAYHDGLAQILQGKLHFTASSGLATNSLLSLHPGRDGGLWIGASRNLQYLKDEIAVTYRVANNFALRAVRALCEDPDGTIWIGNNRGLTSLRDGTFTHYSKGNGPSGIVTALLRDHAGNFWVGTQGGLSRFIDANFSEIQSPEGTSYGVYSLFEDREGDIWVGSEAGLMRLTPKPFTAYTKQSGLAQNATTAVCATRDGSVWIGTSGRGLDRFKNGVITNYARSNGLSSDFVVALMPDDSGSGLWAGTAYASGSAGTYSPGLNRFKDGKILDENFAVSELRSLPTCFLKDHKGAMWIGSHARLFRFDREDQLANSGSIELSNLAVNILCEDHAGNLWIGTDLGLRRWNGAVVEKATIPGADFTNRVLSLYEDMERVLWIGTAGDGLARLSSSNFSVFSARRGLAADSIYAIMEDGQRNLWMNSGKGIFRVAKNQFADLVDGKINSLNCISYGKAEGVLGTGQAQETTQPAACKDSDGRFWFRTTQGVVVTDPAKIVPNRLPPPVVIETVLAGRIPIFSSSSIRVASPTAAALPAKSFPAKLKISPSQGELDIQYTALSLQAPEKNRFKYQLTGVDPDWVDADGRRTVSYKRLPPGSYVFRVIACNNEGIWNESGATVALVLRPHLWQTWWFLSLASLLAIAVVGIVTRYATRRRLQRRLERLEYQHAIERERARIARDMHDELGAKLTRISFQGATALRSLDDRAEAERQVGSMAETARDLVASLDEIVWAVDPGNDSLENLANYIARYASELCVDGPLSCDLIIPAQLPDRKLSTDVRHNIFLAVKESLNNALKHSGGTQVQVSVQAGDHELEVVIADNGHGINQPCPAEPNDRTRRTGHGLGNLQDRLEAINGRCEVKSLPGHGTRVRLIVPLNSAPH